MPVAPVYPGLYERVQLVVGPNLRNYFLNSNCEKTTRAVATNQLAPDDEVLPAWLEVLKECWRRRHLFF